MTRVGERITVRAACRLHRPGPGQAAALTPAWARALRVTGTAAGDVELYVQTAQVPNADVDAYSDISRHRYFNTNNLWVDLRALQRVMESQGGVLGLPMIVNRKTVDPNDPDSTPVIQLETAMGAAVGVFEGARALRVPRTRFAPVKTTSDLLVLRSDAYALTDDARLVLADGRDAAPLVSLDDGFYKRLRDFDERFAAGPPSLVQAQRLEVVGDVRFGAGVVVRGSVRVEGPQELDDGTVLEG